MDSEQNGTQAQQDTQQQEQQAAQQQTNQQETQGKHAKETEADAGAGGGAGAEAYEKQLAERDSRIAELEAQIADAGEERVSRAGRVGHLDHVHGMPAVRAACLGEGGALRPHGYRYAAQADLRELFVISTRCCGFRIMAP